MGEVIQLFNYGTVTRLSSSNLALDQAADDFLEEYGPKVIKTKHQIDQDIIEAAFDRLIEDLKIIEAIATLDEQRAKLEKKIEKIAEGVE